MVTAKTLALRRLLTDGLGGRQFTQTSPVLPDVWLAYSSAPEDPQELLITPDRKGRAGVLARDLRQAVEDWRQTDEHRTRKHSPRIASMPDLVAATLYLDELLRFVVSKSDWWIDLTAPLTHRSHSQKYKLNEDDRQTIATLIKNTEDASSVHGSLLQRDRIWRHEFLWLIAVVGFIRFQPLARRRTPPKPEELLDGFLGVFPDGLPLVRGEGRDNPWRISLNRAVSPASLDSVLAVKADAARRLFDISCARVTWAVIDSGIDQTHPAFADWGKPRPPDGPRAHRVDRTYDFTEVRDLLEPAAVTLLFSEGEELSPQQTRLKRRLELNLEGLGLADPPAAAARHARQLSLRLSDGLEIDWSLLEPFLQDLDPLPPQTGHGTHVAGVLAADWREEPDAEGDAASSPKTILQGVCPDIRLIDIRVLKAGAIREFEVIAALQFIAHLNRRADSQLVQGANLSIETPHNVDNYACGSTPVCEMCNRLWASGVVLVAAAGNRGHQKYMLESGDVLGGYHSISITDPGNADGIITVGSTHPRAHRYGVSWFSSRGPTGDGRRKPDIVAPGEQISGPALNGGEVIANGTSFAAPHVSGAAALLIARFEEFRGQPDRVKAILCNTATDLGREPYFQGAGMVDVLRALQSI